MKRFIHSAAWTLIVTSAILLATGCGDRTARHRSLGLEPGLFHRFLKRAETLSDGPKRELVAELFTLIEESPKYSVPITEETTAVFLYTGDAQHVRIAGDWNEWEPIDTLVHLKGTDLFYGEIAFPDRARLDYKLVVDGVWILDPRNPRTITGGYGPNSELAMPEYVQPVAIQPHPDLKNRGHVEPFTFTSEMDGSTRNVQVYLPSAYAAGDTAHYPTLYVHDGSEYIGLASMVNTLDYCIAKGVCRPLIVVFVDPVDRDKEYWLDDKFMELFVGEIVPMIDRRYRTIDSPESRGVMGSSLGGLTAIYFAYSHPEIFGVAAGQSSALWIDNQFIIDVIENDPPSSVRYDLEWGSFEGDDVVMLNQRLVEVLEEKENPLTWRELPEGHSWGHWRGTIDDLLGDQYPPVAVKK
ncbi:MAG: alpha/beta hydrolase-fold protein [bacterium]